MANNQKRLTKRQWEILGVVAAVVAAATGVASAIVSTVQAWKAHEAASEVIIRSEELGRLAGTAELQLAEAQRLAVATEVGAAESAKMAQATSETAGELAVMTVEARAQRQALERSSQAAERLAKNTENELLASEQRFIQTQRPSLAVARVSDVTVELGKYPQGRIHIENNGPTGQANYWAVSSIVLRSLPFRNPSPVCDAEGVAQMSAISRESNIRTRRNDVLTQDELNLIRAKQAVFVYSGSVCWKDQSGKIYRWFFCYKMDDEESSACEIGNGPA